MGQAQAPELSSLPALRRVVLMEDGDTLSAEDKALSLPGRWRFCARAGASFSQWRGAGAGSEAIIDERLGRPGAQELATIIYTSGTTGAPKGVMLTHRTWRGPRPTCAKLNDTNEEDVVVSYLPLSHIAEQMFSIYLPLYTGAQVCYRGGVDRLRETLLAAGPTLLLAVPRVWEKLRAAIWPSSRKPSPLQRRVIAWARDVGLRAGRYRLEHGKPYGLLALEEKLAERLLFTSSRPRSGSTGCACRL